MKVLENHYNENNTIILNNRIISGSQDFHIDEADKVTKNHEVPKEIMDEAIALAKIEVDDNFDYFVTSEDEQILCILFSSRS